MLIDLKHLPAEAAFDVVVIGAGGAGMAAALYAAIDGASVLLVERSDFVGGTTALSGGTTWVPGTHHAATVQSGGPAPDTLAHAALYLDKAIGDRAPRAMREALLANGPSAVHHIEANSDVKYRACPKHPDYLSDLEGSTLAGRALEPLPFDGRRLGSLFSLLRPPIPEFTVLGGMMVDRTDIAHLLGMKRSLASLRHGLKLLARHAIDRLGHPRGTRLVMGNALVGRLLYSLSQRENVSLALGTSVEQILRRDGRVDGVTLQQHGERRTLRAGRAVILASGGFNRHAIRRQALLPGAEPGWCPAAPGHTGAAQDLALGLGAAYGRAGLSHAFWAPVSLRERADGSRAVFPHFMMDRAKPGMITVDASGRRFVDESTSYHLFGIAMQREPGRVPAHLICDAEALRRYGMGMVRPGGKGLAPYLADGYLVQADSLEHLGRRLGIDGAALRATVERHNAFAEAGVDGDFQRGTTAYSRHMGDTARPGKNPNLGAIATAPFYAVRLYPGDIGAATGLATDAQARVLDGGRCPIPGLYACGNDMHSVMGGVYAGPGITLGPGLVFAYVAVRDALRTTAAAPAAPRADWRIRGVADRRRQETEVRSS